MMKKNKSEYIKWIDSSMVILFFAGILSFLLFTGTLNSGYHFTDDHEMLEMNRDLKTMSLGSTISKWTANDLNIRFRPMYMFHRVLEMKLFGDNFFALSFYTGILIAISFSFFYLGARKLRYSVIESLFLVLLTFVGTQAAIWWRLGPNETVGMALLSLSFYFMARCLANKNYIVNSSLANIFLILASLSKESFVIIVPAFVVFKIWNESREFDISIKKSLQKNYLSAFPLAATAVELYAIIFMVGTNQIGYAGATSSVSELAKGVWTILFTESMLWSWLKFLFLIILLFLISSFLEKSDKLNFLKRSIRKLALPIVFSLLIILPNLALYAKSGIIAHYFLPITLGLAFLVVSAIKLTASAILRIGAFIACAVFLSISFSITKQSALLFASEGADTKAFLDSAAQNANPGSKILLVADPVIGFEFSLSTKIYLAYHGIDISYGFPVSRNCASEFEKGLKENWINNFYNKGSLDSSDPPDEILVYKNQTENFFNESGLSKTDYTNIIENNPHAVYVKR